jgi:methylthioribose-1-phosphate isomerase
MVRRAARRRAQPPAPAPTLAWVGGVEGRLEIIDQTVLPGRFRVLRVRDARSLWRDIRRLAVRGAPAIGVAAAYGVVLGCRDRPGGTPAAFLRRVDTAVKLLASSRPTAVNLFWALEQMRAAAGRLAARRPFRPDKALRGLLEEARAIHDADRALCDAIGRNGAALLPRRATVLTHCNAGALATGGAGTALAVIYSAVAQGKKVRVFADETRPLLQGARLTSWELSRAGIDVTLLCDSAAASVLRSKEVDCVVVGADRIARNGDVANKIGTYGVAVAARAHGVPFYVAAPSTTFDLTLRSGAEIPIEERSASEVVEGARGRTAPGGVAVYNPAFDVTPAKLVTGIITERGILRPPYVRSIAYSFARQKTATRRRQR